MLPHETLVVTFFETPVLAARLDDGTIVLSVRDLCTAVGLRRESQVRRLRVDPDLRDGLFTLRVMTAGGPQEQEFLILEFVPTWITTVNRARASPLVQERLRYLRLFSVRQVYDAIAHAAGLPEGPSRQIEDLGDLRRFDDAMHGLATRQQALEESQEKAREAWRDHEQRLRALEAQLRRTGSISPSQRGEIYQLVHLWAQARVEQEGIEFGAAVAGCWATLKARYRIAKYEHLPAARYDECVEFLRRSYEAVSGRPFTEAQLPLEGLDDQS
ncbi:MAG: hypothetical protein M5U01_12215 [Ardenticatenaceae bacterium]|nr:hypothetical protein [Ardenticatenaceae bacterium]HBY94057.1 hypothetical protein [Chloroflexota bacterium]